MRVFIAACAIFASVISTLAIARADLWVNVHNMKVNAAGLPSQSCELMRTNGNVEVVRCSDGHAHQDRFFDSNFTRGGHTYTCRFRLGRVFAWWTEVDKRECTKGKVNENTYNVYPAF